MQMKCVSVALAAVFTAACSAHPAGSAAETRSAIAEAFVPTGARIEPSGFASVETAPSTPAMKRMRDNRPQTEPGWYAQSNRISEAEARKRIAEQQAVFPEFERLLATLRSKESGNFTSARMVHQPDWAYEFYFKRDPVKSLAKYTSNPRFRPALARYSQAELEAMLKPWTDRFMAHRLTGGWGTDDTYGIAEVMMDVTEEEYRAVAAQQGWGPVPGPIKLKFAAPLPFRDVDSKVAPLVRIFAQNDRSTGIQLTAAGGGRIFMRDGCLYAATAGENTPNLAYFHRETGLGLDPEGYLALIDRATGRSKGRLGEMFTWAGPNAATEAMPMVKELRERCGNAPLFNVGNPESSTMFKARYSL